MTVGSELAIARLRRVLPGAASILLAGAVPGDGQELLVAVAPGDGAVASRAISA